MTSKTLDIGNPEAGDTFLPSGFLTFIIIIHLNKSLDASNRTEKSALVRPSTAPNTSLNAIVGRMVNKKQVITSKEFDDIKKELSVMSTMMNNIVQLSKSDNFDIKNSLVNKHSRVLTYTPENFRRSTRLNNKFANSVPYKLSLQKRFQISLDNTPMMRPGISSINLLQEGEKDLMEEMILWFRSYTKIVPRLCHKYSSILFEEGFP